MNIMKHFGIKEFNRMLSGNQLKIIALIFMTLDHIGLQLFPGEEIFRILGRIAFPIFAYMIAEGAFYTRNRKKYFLNVFIVALLCQLVYFFALGSLYQCIFVTFSLSLIAIFSLDFAFSDKSIAGYLIAAITLAFVFAVTCVFPITILKNTDFCIDYGIIGVMTPVAVYFAGSKKAKLFAMLVCLIVLSASSDAIQWFSMLSLPLLYFYSEKRGTANTKWLFYLYYPLHLVVIYMISVFIK